MADINKLKRFILKWEGKFVNDPDDSGGATNMGVTLATWRAVGYDKDGDGDIDVDDLKLITEDDAVERVMKPHFWDKWQADNIKNQSLANICVDWAWGSGVRTSVKAVQRILGVTADGICGRQTLAALNSADQRVLFNRIRLARIAFVEDIVRRKPSQKKFIKGWKNRINSISFEA
jgi:lysozyme family protein